MVQYIIIFKFLDSKPAARLALHHIVQATVPCRWTRTAQHRRTRRWEIWLPNVPLASLPSSAVGHERAELYLYSPYGPHGLYRASVLVQGCSVPFKRSFGRWKGSHRSPLNEQVERKTITVYARVERNKQSIWIELWAPDLAFLWFFVPSIANTFTWPVEPLDTAGHLTDILIGYYE